MTGVQTCAFPIYSGTPDKADAATVERYRTMAAKLGGDREARVKAAAKARAQAGDKG